MQFDLKKFTEALSLALDFAEMDYFKVNLNHSRRTAYISMMLGIKIGLDCESLKDLYILSSLHDNGVTLSAMKKIGKEFELMPLHCLEGEKNIVNMPFFNDRKNVIKYHHENYDGTGLFRLQGGDIPLFSQIIHLADTLDTTYDLNHLHFNQRTEIKTFVKQNKNTLFNPMLADAFLEIAQHERLWADLNFYNISEVLNRITPDIILDYSWSDILKITEVFIDIIDSKSKFTYSHSRGVSEKAAKMCSFYNFPDEKKLKIKIAANLHDLGKLYIPNEILDKPGLLTTFEFQEIKQHTYFTKLALDKIPGFADISSWAANHHEKLNGRGYPEGLSSDELDFESRMLAVIDIYQALTETRPYRKSLEHNRTIEILNKMADSGFIDSSIVRDTDSIIRDN